MQSIAPAVDSSTPASFVFAQQRAPTKKAMLREGERNDVTRVCCVCYYT